MPFKIILNESDGGVITVFSGVVTDEDVIRSVEEKCSSLEKIQSYRYALTDCTNVEEFKVTSSAVMRNAKVAQSAFSVNSDVLLVSVVPTDLMYGLSRLWQAYADGADRQTKVVRSREEAEAWLAERL